MYAHKILKASHLSSYFCVDVMQSILSTYIGYICLCLSDLINIESIYNKIYISECQIFICDFHREQAWSMWLKASKHGLNKAIDEVLPLLRSIARASTKDDHDNAISILKSSSFWTTNKEFRD